MPCVQIAGHRPALAECAQWRSPTVAAAVKSPSSALVPAARLPGSASWAFSGDLLHGAEPPPSSRRKSSNPHSASRTLGAPPSAISSLGQLPTPAVGARGSVAVAGVRNPAQQETSQPVSHPREIGVIFNLELPTGRAEVLSINGSVGAHGGEHPE